MNADKFIEQVWLEWWKSSGGIDSAVIDTRPNRVNFPPSEFPNKFYVEVDTKLLYFSDGSNWKYIAGILRNTIANKPSSGGATAWSGATAYVVGDLASRLGVDYYCILNHSNHQPPNATYWYPIPALTSNDAGLRFQATDTTQQYVWTGSAWVEDYELTDSAIATVATLIRLVHLSSNAGAPAAGFGARALVELHDSAKNRVDGGSLDVEWTTATAGNVTSIVSILLRSAGAALAKFFQVLSTGIQFKVGSFFGKFVHANTADRTYTFYDADGNIVFQTVTLTDHAIVLGNGGQKVKPGPLGTTATLLHGNAAGDPSYGAVDLAAEVGASILPIANGGMGSATGHTYGTWTPSVKFGGGNTGITYAGQYGYYEKITSSAGTWVRITCYLGLANKGSSVGSMTIEGLPVALINDGSYLANAAIYADNLQTIVGQLQAFADHNTTVINPYYLGTGTGTALSDANCKNNSVFMLSMSYKVA